MGGHPFWVSGEEQEAGEAGQQAESREGESHVVYKTCESESHVICSTCEGESHVVCGTHASFLSLCFSYLLVSFLHSFLLTLRLIWFFFKTYSSPVSRFILSA